MSSGVGGASPWGAPHVSSICIFFGEQVALTAVCGGCAVTSGAVRCVGCVGGISGISLWVGTAQSADCSGGVSSGGSFTVVDSRYLGRVYAFSRLGCVTRGLLYDG